MATEIGISKVEAIKIIAALWHPLTKAQRKVLLKSMKIRKFEKNEVIYRGSDSPRDLMCLVFGKVKVYKEGVSGRSPYSPRHQIDRLLWLSGFLCRRRL